MKTISLGAAASCIIASCIIQLAASFQSPSTLSRISVVDRSTFVSKPWSPVSEKSSLVVTAQTNNPRRRSSSSSGAPTTATSTELQASPLTFLASSPLGAISVLAGIVVVHEAGHYIAARSYNITVDEFSVGFGPKLAGFEALGNEFNLRAFPLGGYVRFPMNYDVNATRDMEEAARQAFMKRREEEGWGPLEDFLNIATLGIWDERRRQKKKKEAALQAAAALEEATKKQNWFQKAFMIGKNNPSKKNSLDSDDPEDFQIEYFDDPNLLQNRPWFQRAVVLSMGVIFNMILAFSLYFGEIRFGSGIPEPVFDSGVVVSQVPMKSGASVGILQQGDIIIGVNGNPLVLSKRGGPQAAQQQVGDVISAIRATPDGEVVKLNIKRGAPSASSPKGSELEVAIQPKKSDEYSPPSIGVMLSPSFVEVQKLKSDNTIEAVQLSYRYFSNVFKTTLDGFLSLLGTLLTGKGTPPGQSVSGPVGLIKTGTEIVSTRDLATVLAFAGALSVNLGVINAFPLPALDGGQLIFVIAEAVTGRKVDQKLQEGLTSAAVLLLLFVTVSTTFSDVGSILFSR